MCCGISGTPETSIALWHAKSSAATELHGWAGPCMQALSSHHVDRNYYQCWSGLQSHFDRNWLENSRKDSSRQQQQQQQHGGDPAAASRRPNSNGSPQHGSGAAERNAEESGAQQAANPLCAQARGAS